MEYVYGALLLNAAGKPIDEKGLTQVLTAAGVSPDARPREGAPRKPRRREPRRGPREGRDVRGARPPRPPRREEGRKGEKKEEEKKEEKGVSEEEAAEGLSALFG